MLDGMIQIQLFFSKVMASDIAINGISTQNLWLYNLSSGEETKVVDDAMLGNYI